MPLTLSNMSKAPNVANCAKKSLHQIFFRLIILSSQLFWNALCILYCEEDVRLGYVSLIDVKSNLSLNRTRFLSNNLRFRWCKSSALRVELTTHGFCSPDREMSGLKSPNTQNSFLFPPVQLSLVLLKQILWSSCQTSTCLPTFLRTRAAFQK